MKKIKIDLSKNPTLILIIIVLFLGLIIASNISINRITKDRNNNESTFKVVSDDSKKDDTQPIETGFKLLQYTPSWDKITVSSNGNLFFLGVTFSESVNLDSLVVEVSPQEDLEIKLNENDQRNIWIRPYGGWDYGKKYKVVIKEIASVSGETIYYPLSHEFLVEETEAPNIY